MSISTTSQLMLIMEIIALHSENHIKCINTLCVGSAQFLNAKPGSTGQIIGKDVNVNSYDRKYS
jgi:hypothetical protein